MRTLEQWLNDFTNPCYKDNKYVINGGKIGEVTQHLYDTLTGIQMGRIEAPEGWIRKIM